MDDIVVSTKAKRSNFVEPLPPPPATIKAWEPPVGYEISMNAPMPTQTVQRVSTSHVDRAKGFTIVSIPLAFGVGLGGLLLGVGLFSVPLFSMTALLILFVAFIATWLIAFLWHQSASPDGVSLWTILLHYRFLRHEQRARLRRMQNK